MSTAKTALVTGATGLLGREVVKAFEKANWSVTCTGFSRASGNVLKVDLTKKDEIEAALDKVKPTALIHCAAERAPDRVDSQPDLARSLNVTATSTLASACAARNIFLLYISTDYVFPGREGEAPYTASSKPGPTNLYGELKLAGEKEVLSATEKDKNGAVLRVPVLYGPVSPEVGNKESATNVLMDQLWAAQEKEVKMDDWSIRYPTLTSDVGRVCKDVAAKFVDTGAEERGGLQRVLQFSAEERFTKYQICELFAEIMGLPMGKMVANKAGNDPNAAVQRPYDCHLSTKELRDLGVDVRCQDFKSWWRWQVGAFKK